MLHRSIVRWRQNQATARLLPRPVRHILIGFVAAFLVLICLAPATAASQSVYVFGDSLSDTGNVFHQLGRPARPYVNGRFSNGLVWVDRLANQLHLTLTPVTTLAAESTATSINFAFGGATTGTDNNANELLGLQQQVQLFRNRLAGQSPSPNAVYFVWAGANDYLGGRSIAADEPIANLRSAIEALIEAGARHIVVGNLPSLGQLPATRDRDTAPALDRLTADHNQQINALVAQFAQQDGMEMQLLDVNALFKRAIAGESNFANVTDACFDPQTGRICSNPESYLFWDGIHPSTVAHRRIAEAALPLSLSMSTASAADHQATPAQWAIGALVLGGLAVGAIATQAKKRR